MSKLNKIKTSVSTQCGSDRENVSALGIPRGNLEEDIRIPQGEIANSILSGKC